MSFTYENDFGETYYLYKKETRADNWRYYFAKESDGQLANGIPDGYEIYEEANGRVHLRKEIDKNFTDREINIIKEGLRKNSAVKHWKLDIKENMVIIFNAKDPLEKFNRKGFITQKERKRMVKELRNFNPKMRFKLVDENKRKFKIERYCLRSSFDDWVYVNSGKLEMLVKKYCKHLGRESFYDLYYDKIESIFDRC